MKCAIAIFAKTAGLSPVKTRLAHSIGTDQAELFYKLSVASIESSVLEAAKYNPDIHPHWALAEAEAVELPQWQKFPAIWTGEGGLGERLANVSEQLFRNHDGVIFIGTDSPQLNPDVFVASHEFLRGDLEKCLVGPATDGGFYLFGSAIPVPGEIWKKVAYSKQSTLLELEWLIEKSGRKVERLNEEQDVDTAEDLERILERLTNSRSTLLPAQRQLLDWLEKR